MAAATLPKRRFTADEYQRMARTGVPREGNPVELMDGQVVVMHSVGPRHNACVAHATRALVRAVGDNAIALPQVSVDWTSSTSQNLTSSCSDLAPISTRHDTQARTTSSSSWRSADSSLAYDRDVKAPVYAAAVLPEYWLVDLNDNVVWRYRSPQRGTYRSVDAHRRGHSIAPQSLPSCAIAVDVLLTE